MASAALSAAYGVVPGILTYGVLRGGYCLFVERTRKLEELFEKFKSDVKGPFEEWNKRHAKVKDQISFPNALFGSGALEMENMRSRECCNQPFQSLEESLPDASLTCWQLIKKMRKHSSQYVSSCKPVAWSIVAGSISCIVLAIFFKPAQVREGGLSSRALYYTLSSIGCLVAGLQALEHFGHHITGLK